MAFLGTFAAMGKSTSRQSAKYSYGKDFGTVAKSRSRPETRNFSVRHGQKYLAVGTAKHPCAGARNVPLPETVPVPGERKSFLVRPPI